jgi:hypothetical protein
LLELKLPEAHPFASVISYMLFTLLYVNIADLEYLYIFWISGFSSTNKLDILIWTRCLFVAKFTIIHSADARKSSEIRAQCNSCIL